MFRKILNAIFPKTCANCECIIHPEHDLCKTCKHNINFLDGNYCISCGSSITQGISICGKCIGNPPIFTELGSVFAYNKHSKNMILNLKFFDNTLHIKTYAKWIYNKNTNLFNGITTIIPVPIHKKRLQQRKYNQATLLAKALSKYCNIPLEIFVLERILETTPQYNLSSKMRQKNITKAFIVKNKHTIKDKTILLVDDIITTGITARTCAYELISSGAKEVKVVTLGRTLQ